MVKGRERIRRLLDGDKIDRIPFGLGGCETESMHVLSYNKLKKILGFPDMPSRMYTFMANAVFEIDVLEKLDADIVTLGSGMCPAPLWGAREFVGWKETELWGETILIPKDWEFDFIDDGTVYWKKHHMKCPPGGWYFDWIPIENSYDYIFKEIERPDPGNYNPPKSIPDQKLRELEESACWLYENTEFAIACGEVITDLQLKPGGYTDWCVRMVNDPQMACEFLSKACDAAISQFNELSQAVGKYCEIIGIADDIGGQNGIMIGPDLWRRIYKPHYKRLFSEIHRISKMKINFHSCGSVFDIIDDLIDCGVDILNPVQISAKNMEPEKLKSKTDRKLILYGGGYDASLIPVSMDEAEVYEAIKKNLSVLACDGRYIFSGVHNITPDIPESHIKAFLNAYSDSKLLMTGEADDHE